MAGYRVGLLGHYHGGNQGDDVVVDAVISGIRARRPDAEIIGFSQAPVDSSSRHGITAHAALRSVEPTTTANPSSLARLWGCLPLSRLKGVGTVLKLLQEVPFWYRSYQRLRGLDLLVVPGSGQLLDGWRGPRGHPYVFFGWSVVARLARVPLIFLCTGAGPVNTRLGRFFIREAVRSAVYVSFRDQGSAEVIRNIGVGGELPVANDLAFTLTPQQFPRLAPPDRPQRERPLVGLNVMTHDDPRHEPMGKQELYERYLRAFADFGASLVETGYDVLLFSSDTADPMAFTDIIELMRPALGDKLDGHVRVDDAAYNSADGLLSALAQCDHVVASRYHCVLLSYLMGTPALGVAYNQKTFALARSVGLGEYCVDADTFEGPELAERFTRLVTDTERAQELLARAIPTLRAQGEAQLDRAFGPRLAQTHAGASRNAGRPGATDSQTAPSGVRA